MAGCGHGCVMAVAYAPLFSRRCVRRSGTESLQTLRWREPDSNHRSRRERDGRGERPHGRPSSSREATKQGISSIELGRRLGVSQTTAWKVKHKLKQVMIERDATKKLTGRIEIDDAYLGGEHSGGKRGRGAAGKTPFLAAVETTADGKPVSLKLGRVSGFSSNALSGFAKRNFDRSCQVVSDGLACFSSVTDAGCTHQAIKTGY